MPTTQATAYSMGWPGATGARPSAQVRVRGGARWYVPGAVGEETATSVRPPPGLSGARLRAASLAAAGALLTGLVACGDDAPRQDAAEPSGEFAVELVSARFPAKQRLAEETDLALELRNPGSDPVPNLVVTVRTGNGEGTGPFSLRSEQPGLSSPSRPAWILENGYPKAAAPGERGLDALPGGTSAARTNTFAFGPLESGESTELVWRVTPIEPGEYTVAYEVAASLNGKAKAVSEGGDPVGGRFDVTISEQVPRIEVTGAGDVVIQDN